jgi:hypothetical protein
MKNLYLFPILVLILFFLFLPKQTLSAQESTPPAAASAEELAKKLANPIANLISVPIQGNLDVGIGAYNGSKLVVNVQPVIPITLSPKLNLITRWILPIVSQFDITGQNTQQSGLGDAVITGFLSPSQSSLTWGVGAAFLVPTATENVLGGEKFGVGPSAVVLKQSGPWTYGALVNHLFSVAGNEDRDEVSATFLNPFASYNWKSGAGITTTLEYTQDWEHDASVMVAHAMLSGVTKFGSQTISLAIGPRIHFAPDQHAAYGIRAAITMVFPK